MPQQRTVTDKIEDTRQAYAVLREELTPDVQREMRENVAAAQKAAIDAGDLQLFESLVQTGITLHRVIAQNDRAAMIAAAMITQSGVSRPQLDVVGEE